MPRSTHLFALSILALAFAACATPAPLVRLQPRGPVTWVAGRGVLSDERAGVQVAAAFDHQDGDHLGLRLEIRNDTDAAFVVGPGDVTFMKCTHETASEGRCSYSYPAVDPERMLLALDEKSSRERAAAANAEASYGPLLMLGVIADVASLASPRGGGAGSHTLAVGTQIEAESARRQTERLSIHEQRQHWSNAVFRRSTVPPGGGVGGLVYLPIELEGRYLWVHVRAAGKVFPFGFEQKVRQVQP